MDEFTCVPTRFQYHAGKQTHAGTINVSPSNLHQAARGDKYAIKSICKLVAEAIRSQGVGFQSFVKWNKIKWP